MSYHDKSRAELISILDAIYEALGCDVHDPLGFDIVERAKRVRQSELLYWDKYKLLMVEYATAFGIDGAEMMRRSLLLDNQSEIQEALREDIESFKRTAKIRFERAAQLSLAAAEQEAQHKAFEAMIAARKADEICRGVSSGIMTAAGLEIRKD